MRKIILCLLALWTVSVAAQVTTTPSIIEAGYKGKVIISYDPTGGNGGMAKATKCYAHTGLITSESKDKGDWKFTKSEWRAANTPQLTKNGDKWELTIDNIYTFYGAPESTEITALAFVFHDGPGGTMEGKTASGSDIYVIIGEESGSDDIWAGFTPATAQTQARPSGIDQGIYYDPNDPTVVTLCTFAAGKKAAGSSELEPAQHVFLLGDMTNWKLDNNYQLKRDGNYFWIKVTGLEPGKEYRFQYVVVRADGVRKQISDLFSEKVIHPDDKYEPRKVNPDLIGYPLKGADGGYVTVIQTNKSQFQWSSATLNFKRPNKNNLIIYELWVYDHTPARSIEGLMERLDYLQNLGVNAIELMPVTEFDGNLNWGYSPNHYFALDRAYGSPEQLKTFIDECHKRGMAVILDMVFNHATGLNPMNKLYPYTSSSATTTELRLNPWFNVSAPHPDNVYEDWNHDFEPAHKMFIRALKYWIQEYKVDGYRMDLSHGLCGASYNAVTNLKDYYQNGVKAAASDAYFILEHWGDHMNEDRPQLVNEGMMCWQNTTTAYEQTAMGWLKDGDDLSGANMDNYVSYCTNHDEERPFFKAKQWGDGDITSNEESRCARVPLNMAFLTLLNGPQLFYHYEELGFDYSKWQNVLGQWGENPYGITKEVLGEQKMNPKYRPEAWINAEGPRMRAYQKTGQIIQLRTRLMPEVFEGNPTATSIGSGKALRTIQWGSNVFVAGNFSTSGTQSVTLPSGTWYDYLAGGSNASSTYTLQPGEVKVFTGKKVTLPSVPAAYSNIEGIEDIVISPSTSKAQKIMMDGQIYILRGDKIYTITGQPVR